MDIVSGSTGLLFRYAKPQQHLPLPHVATFGSDVLAKVAETLKNLGRKKEPAPDVDLGVLASLKDLGETLERKKITRISLSVPRNDGKRREVKAVFTPSVQERVATMMKKPMFERTTVEGKLEMVDFKETGRVCRIHPSIGVPVQCSFESAMESQVYDAIRKPTRVSGTATLNPNSGKIDELKIDEIEIVDKLLLGAKDFFASKTVEQLAEAQGVHPLKNPAELAGGWPPDENIDEFIEATYSSRS